MPAKPLSLTGAPFIPTVGLTGSQPLSIYRGYNAFVRGLDTTPYIENYLGHKDLSEDYALSGETLSGTLSWTSGSTTITSSGGILSDVQPGQFILSATEIFVVDRKTSDTQFIAKRAPTTTASTQTAYYMFVMFEIGKKRGVLRRGNGFEIERGDIVFAGTGQLFLNGVGTGFNASHLPRRLERSTTGTYSEFPLGFPDPPPSPDIAGTTGGWKLMQAGNFSFMVSWWNSVTDGYSNPSPVVKRSGGADIVIAAGGRFTIDVTALLAVKPTNADGVLIWGSLSGGGVATVNTSNFSQGAWYETTKMRFTGVTITAVNTTSETITIANHKFKTADYVVYTRTGGTTDLGGLTSGNRYYVIYVDENTIKLATTSANALAGTAIDLTGAGDGTQRIGYFDSADLAYFEYLDTETGGVVSGDNDPPPSCEWVTEFSGSLQFISCFGNAQTSTKRGSSLGSFVVPGKPANREASPYRWRVGVKEEIHGFAEGSGRLFLLTPGGIPFITPTGRTELPRLTPTPLDFPFTWRPFWTKGSVQPYSLIVIQGDTYLYSGSQFLRSPSSADEKTAPFEIGKYVRDLTKDYTDGYVFSAHDPKNQQACIVASATKKNSDGYWISEILPLDLTTNPPMFQPKIILSSATRDMIVTGMAVVNSRFEFLAGGRVASSTPQLKTYRYDERVGSGSIDWAVAWQPTDNGIDDKAKYIKSFRLSGRFDIQPIVQVHGATWASPDISPDDIENGVNSITGNITIPITTDTLVRGFRKKREVKNLSLYSVRVSSTWTDDGSKSPDRFDELVCPIGVHGGSY